MAAKMSNGILKEISQNIQTRGMTPAEIQHTYGLSFDEIREHIACGDLPQLGDPTLYEYIISIKARDGFWPNHHAGPIMRAKETCDRGTTNLTYGYTSGLLMMYSIPRKFKEFRKPWFFGEVGGGVR